MELQMKPEKNKRNRKFIPRDLSGWTILLPSVFLFFMIVWRPIVIGVLYSFFDLKGFTPSEFIGLQNYRNVLADTNFLQTLSNTVRYVLWSLLIGFPLPFICAVILNEMIYGQSYFKISIYLPVVIPVIATSMIWRMVYMEGPGGLLNMMLYRFGIEPMVWLNNKSLTIPLILVSMTWNSFGRTMIMYLSTLQGVNQELYEAARLDGAGIWGRIKYVLFPHMRGIMLLMLVSQIIGVFNITEQPLAMTGGGPNGASMSLGLTNYFYAFKYSQYGKSLALGVVIFFILSVLTFVYFRMDKNVND